MLRLLEDKSSLERGLELEASFLIGGKASQMYVL